MPEVPLPAPPAESAAPAKPRGSLRLRRPIPRWQAIVLGVACLLSVALLWWLATRGEPEERLVGPLVLTSPEETFGKFRELWFEQEFARNLVATLFRVATGFLLAMIVGIPIGVLAGCFPRVNAFLAPLISFGRNIPVAALVPLVIFAVNTDFLFGRGENRKIVFIFVACVAFVLADTARAIIDVAERYVDTAFTLGASRWQTIMKVLVPLALPTVISSCRLMFGIAFGYIMLAEITREPNTYGGLGFQINTFQRIGKREEVYLIILIVPLVALVIDQLLYWMQRSLFPYQYQSDGLLNHAVRAALHVWDDLKRKVLGVPAAAQDFRLRNGAATVEPAAATNDDAEPTEPQP